MSAKDLSAARRTSIIGSFPKIFIPILTVVPGLLALALLKDKIGPGGLYTYNDAIPYLIGNFLPNGVLGVALTGLLAAFMAGMAANISSFNTVWTYDIWRPYIVKDREDSYYLRHGRIMTVVGIVISMGTAFMLSQITVLYCTLGSDSVVHISEEVKDASVTVPRCMVWSYVGNVLAALCMMVAMLFCIGPLDGVLEADVPYAVLFNNTGSRPLSLFLNVVLLILIYAGNITSLATSAREMWAFSRDKGLPFSGWLGKM